MTDLTIYYTYRAIPGECNWDYSSQSITYQMVFFADYFRNK